MCSNQPYISSQRDTSESRNTDGSADKYYGEKQSKAVRWRAGTGWCDFFRKRMPPTGAGEWEV